MTKKVHKRDDRFAVFDSPAVRTLGTPPDETCGTCPETPLPLIVLKPKAWARLSQCMFMAGNKEFGAYGVTRRSEREDGMLYEVLDVVIPEQEATSGFVQPLFPAEAHAALQAEDENVGLFTHIHSHHDMNMSFSAYDRNGPLRNNQAAVVLNTKTAPKGFAVAKTACGKKTRVRAIVAVGETLDDAMEFASTFRGRWKERSYPLTTKSTKKAGKNAQGGNNKGEKDGKVIYSKSSKAVLLVNADAPVVLGRSIQMGWLASMKVGSVHHFRLDTSGVWFHEHKAKCLKRVNDADVLGKLWATFFGHADVALVREAWEVVPPEYSRIDG